MQNIQRMIQEALVANGAPVALLLEPTDTGFSASLIDMGSNETITMQSDWQIELAIERNSVEHAIRALDEICAEDFQILARGK